MALLWLLVSQPFRYPLLSGCSARHWLACSGWAAANRFCQLNSTADPGFDSVHGSTNSPRTESIVQLRGSDHEPKIKLAAALVMAGSVSMAQAALYNVSANFFDGGIQGQTQFTGSFDWDGNTGTVSNFTGLLSESMWAWDV